MPRSLMLLCEELKVEIRTSAEVEKILIENKRACGVRLMDGTVRRCDVVIANSDAVETYRTLIDEDARRIYTNKKLARIEPSC